MHTEYQVNHKTQPFCVKVVHLIPNVQTLAGHEFGIELVSKELNHFGVNAGLFRQIGGHSSRFVLFCSF